MCPAELSFLYLESGGDKKIQIVIKVKDCTPDND